ncbi:uncharacterized protein LOC129748064 [Uranotaenia lowii]|uniref:uncharacterized protein LOC129748064 n=1 Tax=Uranotaenia lowii TaxID=190385 RepID=UPI002479A1FC|nr:uncharacterized protein LOC129748064 [Uranotaenia lowii]
MGGCGEWIEMNQKNKPQSNTLAGGIMTLMVTGMIVGSTIFNMDLQYQPWTFDHSDRVILLTQISFYMAAIVGTIAGFFLVERHNKKAISRVYLVLAGVGCLLLIILPDHIASVAFARVLLGLAHGLAYLVVLIHAGETSIKELRGLNTVAVNYCLMIGVVTHGSLSPMAASAEEIAPNRIIGIIGTVYIIFGGLLSQFLTYESPVFLIQRGRDGEAIQSMIKLRNESTETWEIRNDYTEFKTMLAEDEDTSRSIFQDGNLRPLTLLILCKLATVLSFNTGLNLVRLHILNTLFGLEDYSLSAVSVLTIRLTVGTVFLFVIDKFGRRAAITASSFSCGMVMVIMGIVYLVADSINRDIAIAIMLSYEVVASAGITFVPDVYCSEAFSTKKKAASVAVVQIVENVLQLAIVCIVSSWNFQDASLYGGVMMVCGVPLLVITGVFYRYLPETTKMSIRQARTEFTKRGEIVFGGTKRPQDFLND